MPRTDFELQHARMTVLHSERDDLRLEKTVLLSRSDILLEHRKELLADMREFAAAGRAQSRETASVLLAVEGEAIESKEGAMR
jgi:hypothetical protein